METRIIRRDSDKGTGIVIAFLCLMTFFNGIFLIGTGFSGKEDTWILNGSVPLKTSIELAILNLICSFYISTKIKRIFIISGLILAFCPLLFTFNAIIEQTERDSLMTWLAFSVTIYSASYIGGLFAILFEKIKFNK